MAGEIGEKRGAKHSEIWDSDTLITNLLPFICCIFDLVVFMVMLGTLAALV